ncbi:MAG: 5'-3' exonuclease H3TH domain-containing protein, partial [Gammaproteobacteria bacterium]|nr:5'-3' exonuclease H3TH domain-containing protein [Gammaproteobacteria bacterium]
FGVHPEQFPDYLGLVGDSVDRISGVPGVGPVKAKEILQHFQSLKEIYLNLDKMAELPLRGAGRLADLLEEHRELAELSKVLATIVCDVEDPEESFSAAGLSTLQINDIDEIELSSFLNTYKFSARDNDRIMSAARRISKI